MKTCLSLLILLLLNLTILKDIHPYIMTSLYYDILSMLDNHIIMSMLLYYITIITTSYKGEPHRFSYINVLFSPVGVTVLGTGAKWLAVLEEKGVKPRETHNLSALRAILSTGSPLPSRLFKYVYRDIKKDVLLGSISGE